jgi:hypothetical protein
MALVLMRCRRLIIRWIVKRKYGKTLMARLKHVDSVNGLNSHVDFL